MICDPREGCGPFREHRAQVREHLADHDRRLGAAEDEQKTLHGRVTANEEERLKERNADLVRANATLVSVVIAVVLQIIGLVYLVVSKGAHP